MNQEYKNLVPIVTTKPWVKILFSLVLIISVLVGGIYPDQWTQYVMEPVMGVFDCFYGRALDSTTLRVCASNEGFFLRLVYYLLSFPAILGIMSLVPTRRLWGLTTVGVMSFNVFVWHFIVLYFVFGALPLIMHAIDPSQPASLPPFEQPIMKFVIPAISILVSLVLAVPCLVRYTCCCLCASPPVEGCFKRQYTKLDRRSE